MKFLDVFPYDKNEYSQVIDYFEKSIGTYFQKILSEYAKGIQYNTFTACCLNLPRNDDIVPPNKPCQKSRSIFSVGRIEKGTDLVRI